MVSLPPPLPIQDEEIAVLKPRPRPMLDAWMESGYYLPAKTGPIEGYYSFEYTPFLRRPAALLTHPPVKVGLESCTQIGKSTFMVGVFCYIVQNDPGPTLFVMPTREDAQRRVNARIKPVFEKSPELLGHLNNGDLREFNITKETIFDQMIAYLAFSTSPSALADNPICNALVDEVGKFHLLLQTGENPMHLIDLRQRTFASRFRTLYVTSPQDEGDIADTEFRSGTDERSWVPCMLCGCWHRIGVTMETFYLEKDPDGKLWPHQRYQSGEAAAYYQCPHCRQAWSELNRAASNAAGVWLTKTQWMDPNGKIHGQVFPGNHYTFRINSMMGHPRLGCRAVTEAVEFVKAQEALRQGDIQKLVNYTRNQKAEPFRQIGKTIKFESLQGRILDSLPKRVVPNEALMLVAGADYHETLDGQVRIDFEVRAFGLDRRNWVVLAGDCGSFEELEEQVFQLPFVWRDATDKPNPAVRLLCIDSRFKTLDVYLWCRLWKHVAMPTMGYEFLRNPVDVKSLGETARKSRNREIRHHASLFTGMNLVDVDTSFFSDMITGWIETDDPTAGYTEYTRDLPERYLKEFTGMVKVEVKHGAYKKMIWKPKTEHTPVHYHDTARNAAAAGFLCKIFELNSEQAGAAAAEHRKRTMPRRRYRRVGTIGN